ncbi:MAG: hypothetical protein KDG50_03270 [Chromatiales bacterium]|nr:hypothetical protein [Chromatiales bacterium]
MIAQLIEENFDVISAALRPDSILDDEIRKAFARLPGVAPPGFAITPELLDLVRERVSGAIKSKARDLIAKREVLDHKIILRAPAGS